MITNGKIIFLNGASSSGKTAIAKALQTILDVPFLRVGVDQFLGMMPNQYFGTDPSENNVASQGFYWVTHGEKSDKWYEIKAGPEGLKLIKGLHRSIACLCSIGNNIIIDDVLLSQEWLVDYLKVLEGYSVWFVGVFCPIDVIEQRERDRGDRTVGQARGHFEIVHSHGIYDLELDTSIFTPEVCATKIVDLLQIMPSPKAFDELRPLLLGN